MKICLFGSAKTCQVLPIWDIELKLQAFKKSTGLAL
jgi:hypothetical protein